MQKKSMQLTILFFLALFITFGSIQIASTYSLAETQVLKHNKIKDNPLYDLFWMQSEKSNVDAYANWFIEEQSYWYLYGENALGAPDEEFAIIYIDYANGYLILDMGLNQEIVNGTGPDFTVITGGGEYIVRVGNNFTSPFTIIGTGSGNKSYDLSVVGFTSARYVWIECITEEENVELDAIEALNYNQPDFEADPPQITGPEDFWIWSDQTTVQVSWEVSDLNPYNYSILIGNAMVEQSSWDESLITYKLGLTDKNDTVEITIILEDIFQNRAEDTVTIELRSRPSTSESNPSSFPVISLLSGLLTILLLRKGNNRKDRR